MTPLDAGAEERMARFEFKLPDIGEGIVEGEIVKWLVREGDPVEEDQPMVEVMTDKATVVIPSPRRGRVAVLHGAEGSIAKVHAPLVTLETEAEPARVASAEGGVTRGVGTAERAGGIGAGGPSGHGNGAEAAAAPRGGKVLATPVTRRIAREHGLRLAEIHGSGPNGRVLKSDVEQALAAPRKRASPSEAAAAGEEAAARGISRTAQGQELPAATAGAFGAGEGDRRVPLRGLRRAMAKKMVQSKFSAPHSTFVEEVDATELKALRDRLNARLAAAGDETRLSFLPFVAKAVAATLRRHPALNATFEESSQELVIRAAVHLGFAVATEDGLVVPVVRDVQAKGLRQLGLEIADAADAARERRLRPEQLQGGTFTITSLGAQGGLFATPIINVPEVAILGLHRMRPQPVVREGAVVIRDMMYASLSFDHRVIDGAAASAFVYDLIRLLESPELFFLELA